MNSNKNICRTHPATTGLLKINIKIYWYIIHGNAKYKPVIFCITIILPLKDQQQRVHINTVHRRIVTIETRQQCGR